MFQNELSLYINQRPYYSSFSKKSPRSFSSNPNNCSAFGTSCRKYSKFDVADPLNTNLITPGPGQYKDLDHFQPKPSLAQNSFEKLSDQYETQSFFQDLSEKISFKRPVKKVPENLNLTHPAEPKISFPKTSADRKLWEPKNLFHPYELPDRRNPGPGNYEKHYAPVHAVESNWFFKSKKHKFEEITPRGVGPGSYSQDLPKKLPDCYNFLSKAERVTKIKLDDSVSIAPAPVVYTPYVPANSHCSSYVFNSGTKRGCQTIPAASVGVGAYNIDVKEKHPVSFPKTDRDKFDYFKGQAGVGPAHYVNTGKKGGRAWSLDFYSDRFFPVDKTGVYVIPEAEDDNASVVIREKIKVAKKNKNPFNSSENRFGKDKDLWVKKKVVPDPGSYKAEIPKKIGFGNSCSPRFPEKKIQVPGPGDYDLNVSPLKKLSQSGIVDSKIF